MALAKLLIEDVLESVANGEITEDKGVAQKSKYFRDVTKLQMECVTPAQWKTDVKEIVEEFGDDDTQELFDARQPKRTLILDFETRPLFNTPDPATLRAFGMTVNFQTLYGISDKKHEIMLPYLESDKKLFEGIVVRPDSGDRQSQIISEVTQEEVQKLLDAQIGNDDDE